MVWDLLTNGLAAAGLRVLDPDPHEEERELTEDHDDGGDEDHPSEAFRVPPEDADQVGYDEDEGDEGRETLRTIRLDHRHRLHHVAEARPQDHA